MNATLPLWLLHHPSQAHSVSASPASPASPLPLSSEPSHKPRFNHILLAVPSSWGLSSFPKAGLTILYSSLLFLNLVFDLGVHDVRRWPVQKKDENGPRLNEDSGKVEIAGGAGPLPTGLVIPVTCSRTTVMWRDHRWSPIYVRDPILTRLFPFRETLLCQYQWYVKDFLPEPICLTFIILYVRSLNYSVSPSYCPQILASTPVMYGFAFLRRYMGLFLWLGFSIVTAFVLPL